MGKYCRASTITDDDREFWYSRSIMCASPTIHHKHWNEEPSHAFLYSRRVADQVPAQVNRVYWLRLQSIDRPCAVVWVWGRGSSMTMAREVIGWLRFFSSQDAHLWLFRLVCPYKCNLKYRPHHLFYYFLCRIQKCHFQKAQGCVPCTSSVQNACASSAWASVVARATPSNASPSPTGGNTRRDVSSCVFLSNTR